MKKNIDFREIVENSLRIFPASNLYFLIDQGGFPGVCQKLSRTSAAWANLFAATIDESALDVAPIVILVGSKGNLHLSQSLIQWIGVNGTYTSSVTILLSPLPIALMTERLKSRLNVLLSEDLNAMLRFFDPRILESLNRILSEEQFIDFFCAAEEWMYVDRVGCLKRIKSKFRVADEFSKPLVLSQKQENALIDASEIDQVLDLIRTNVPAAVAGRPSYEQYEFIIRKVEAAKKEGLDSVFKYTLYVAVSALEGEDFMGTPKWARFLDKLNRNELDLMQNHDLVNLQG